MAGIQFLFREVILEGSGNVVLELYSPEIDDVAVRIYPGPAKDVLEKLTKGILETLNLALVSRFPSHSKTTHKI